MIRIYIASKVIHAPKWRQLREHNIPVINKWIDIANTPKTTNKKVLKEWYKFLWDTCISDVNSCTHFILYNEKNDNPLQGTFIELGVALQTNKKIYAVSENNYEILKYYKVKKYSTIEKVLEEIFNG